MDGLRPRHSRLGWFGDSLSGIGGTAAFVSLDVTDDASWESAISAAIGELGGLDIVVNNAGIGTALGIKHTFLAMRPGGPVGGGGAVVNISSVAATIPFPGIAGYSATKAAVDRLTRVAALESGQLGYGVRVNCVYPGLVPTEMGAKLAQDMVTHGLWPSAEAPASSPARDCRSIAAWVCDPVPAIGKAGDEQTRCRLWGGVSGSCSNRL